MEDRERICRERIFQIYYHLNDSALENMKLLVATPREQYFTPDFNKKLGSVNAIILRTMLLYDRYFEANKILSFLDPKGLKVLDFGCGVGDYGITMARFGATVTFCDFKELTDFVQFRCQQEQIPCKVLVAPIPENKLSDENFDLVIFGEVLEHIPHPLNLLQALNKVKYIYTSSFPYKAKESFAEPGHMMEAFQEQMKCLQYLETHYDCNTLAGAVKVWSLKPTP